MTRRPLLIAILASFGLGLAGCATPPGSSPAGYIKLKPIARSQLRPRPRLPPCENPVHSRLTESQKATLFQEFDAWKDENRAPGEPPDASVPPATRTAPRVVSNRACRVIGS